MKRLIALTLVLLFSISLVACGAPSQTTPTPAATTPDAGAATPDAGNTQEPSDEVYKVMALFPLSGAAATSGLMMQLGLEAFIDYWDENLGFENKPGLTVEWVYADTESSAEAAVQVFERYVATEDIDAAMGNYQSATTVPCVAIADRNQIPYMVTAAVSDKNMANPTEFAFRINPGDKDLLRTHQGLFELFEEYQGKKFETAAIISSADDFGLSSSTNYKNVLIEMGIELTLDETIQPGATDASGAVNKLKQANPDFGIVILALNEAVIFQKQMQEYDCNVTMYTAGGGYAEPAFRSAVSQELSDYSLSSGYWWPDCLSFSSDTAKEIYQKSQDKNNQEWNEATACAWASAAVLMDAVDRAASTSGPDVAAALRETNIGPDHYANMFLRYEGIAFEDFDGRYNQNKYAKAYYAQLINNEWKVVFPTTFIETNPLVWPQPTWAEREALIGGN